MSATTTEHTRLDDTIRTALVVDNDPGVCTFMKILLENEGITVTTAADGLDALAILESFVPDIMFIDLIMPNISGDKLGQVIRSQSRFAETYLIVLSAISSEEEIDYLSWGFDACIAKGPFKTQGEIVLSVLRQLGTTITRTRPGGVYGVENLYKREITRELLSTKRHFELILNNMVESIIETTREGRIIFVNPAAADLLGKTEEELLSTDLYSLFTDDAGADLPGAVISALENGTAGPLLFDHNDKKVTVQIHTVSDEGIVSIVIIASDVTEQRRAEEALQRAHDQLEDRVRERTAELKRTNISLQEQIDRREALEQRLRASIKEKEAMLDEIHHRVKNNLQVISSLMGLNANRIGDARAREVIDDIRRRVHSLSLVHDRLYRSQDLAAVDAQDYFKRLVDGLVASLAHKDLSLTVKIDADGITLPIDIAVPCALITNEILTNTFKHAFKGRSEGTVLVKMTKSDEEAYILVVGDDGVGIPSTVDVTSPDTLGFRIIKVLAKQLGATFKLRRTGGTRFRFHIPVGTDGGKE